MLTRFVCLLFLVGWMWSDVVAQTTVKPRKNTDSLYNANIKKSNLYGVYIPRDIDDALEKLMELTTEQARKPMVKVHEDTIARRLHFGIGRWMEYNWNFVEGSRFSHYLRQKGLTDTDDMVRFMIITFHRHVSNKPLDTDTLLAKIVKEREQKRKAENAKREVISTQKIVLDKKG
jgi:hypothetical protein